MLNKEEELMISLNPYISSKAQVGRGSFSADGVSFYRCKFKCLTTGVNLRTLGYNKFPIFYGHRCIPCNLIPTRRPTLKDQQWRVRNPRSLSTDDHLCSGGQSRLHAQAQVPCQMLSLDMH